MFVKRSPHLPAGLFETESITESNLSFLFDSLKSGSHIYFTFNNKKIILCIYKQILTVFCVKQEQFKLKFLHLPA